MRASRPARLWAGILAAALVVGTGGPWGETVRAAAPSPPGPSAPGGGGAGSASSAPASPVRIAIVGIPADAQSGRWDPAARRWIFSPQGGRVVAEWEGWRADAARLEWDPDGRTVELSGSVKMTSAELDAAAERVQIWYEQRRVRLSGGARLDQFTVAGGKRGKLARTLLAPTIEMDDRAGILTAEPGVELRQDEPRLWATGDALRYERPSGLIVLTSRQAAVRAVFDGFELRRASRLEYRVETEELKLFGPAEIVQIEEQKAAAGSSGTP